MIHGLTYLLKNAAGMGVNDDGGWFNLALPLAGERDPRIRLQWIE